MIISVDPTLACSCGGSLLIADSGSWCKACGRHCTDARDPHIVRTSASRTRLRAAITITMPRVRAVQ